MELLILRHAIAFPKDAKRWPDDGERPLTADGVKRARRAAAGLKRIASRPSLVLTSPLVRARDTAAIFTQAAHWPKARECAALSPQGSGEGVLEALRQQAGKSDWVAVVGHQPHLGHLLALCLRGGAQPEAFELRKSAIARLHFDGPPRAGQGVLRALYPPRALRQLGRTKATE
ncbi:MAG TPA: phosphohistidine phosphatase SixA [Steroidobacteraceae bacterium]|jgi:phosphohistidine phosphatase|nr:phosphohistidine phosphatase SixA [Steroidobacteraceae bacterium]